MMNISNISQLVTDLTGGLSGQRIAKPRILHPQGIFYQGFVYDSNNNKLPIHARYSIMPLNVPPTNIIKYYLAGLAIRVYKTLDDDILQQSMQIDETGKSKAFSMLESGVLADCIVLNTNSNPRPQTLDSYTPNDTFANHGYFKPRNLYQALIQGNLLGLRLTGNFPSVMRVENVIRLLGHPPLSSKISPNSIVELNIHKDDPEYPDHYKLVMNIPNRQPINFYLHKTPHNPDPTSNSLDTNNIKFIHDTQPFNIHPRYKRDFWRYSHILHNYLSSIFKYLTNTYSNDIYEEIPRAYIEIQKMSV